ncbi:MAG: hypothetical protein KAW41_02865 [Candidatus Diapherotrites archaeon]|nr:hypothetical protein [Candidatus Diapherotrites archaeon]
MKIGMFTETWHPQVNGSLFPFASLFPGNPLGFARRQKPWGKSTRFARGAA